MQDLLAVRHAVLEAVGGTRFRAFQGSVSRILPLHWKPQDVAAGMEAIVETDIPLKALLAACAADLLPLLGAEDAEVLGVESLELPASAKRLDSLLRLRSLRGTTYLRLVEWQGYHDPLLQWRALGYLGWLGEHRVERPILLTLVYVTPQADIGDTLIQELDGEEIRVFQFHCVRLWEQDAVAAVRGGRVGLAVLSPLMRGATPALVEEAAAVVLEIEEGLRQADLLTILGVFAEPLVPADRFVAMMGRERLMASELITYLMRERTEEFEQQRATLEQERATLEQQRAALEQERATLEQERDALVERVQQEQTRVQQEQTRVQQEQEKRRQAIVQAIGYAVAARFPTVQAASLAPIATIPDPERLQTLLAAMQFAPDQQSAERLLREAVAPVA